MDLVDVYRHSLTDFIDRVHQVRPEQWPESSPCPGWDVRALVNHLVGQDRWTVELLAGATIAEVGDRFDGDLLGTDPVGIVTEAAKQAQAAVTAPGALDRSVHLSYGPTPADEYVRQLFADHLIHAWDLAAAIGVDRHLDSELVRICSDWFSGRAEMYRRAGVIGPPVALPEPVGQQDVLLAAFGRDPAWSSIPI
ncbi:TIGR03086 family metal-binding protein [Planosporangium mesophilum]|uniref:TIGR03086 family protein n=1 Tax=Planosporangium mesophilum TaxID=689768 RepID=A0A8J3X199_9ACTN|nr:TIGR03086 family metal-binding protein [Planosporangium mesophilum]NJC84263.1 TIGR03086 family protein [Planosporangium mesophilum]GII23104.1 TIGR03086 family protein [Planosporangium mesophilum]